MTKTTLKETKDKEKSLMTMMMTMIQMTMELFKVLVLSHRCSCRTAVDSETEGGPHILCTVEKFENELYFYG